MVPTRQRVLISQANKSTIPNREEARKYAHAMMATQAVKGVPMYDSRNLVNSTLLISPGTLTANQIRNGLIIMRKQIKKTASMQIILKSATCLDKEAKNG
jgi:hypothetical protein